MKAEPRFALLLGCFFLSGFAALIYQTAWTRQFAFVFGASELAIATVLAAYMGGLAAGAAVAVRLARRIRRPILVYGLLELGIALAALAVPAALAAATALYGLAFGGGSELPDSGGLARALFYLASSFAILLVPTGLMGATLPLLTRHAVRRESEIGSRVGILYATNTAGAVAGTVVAGFALLPALGLERTIWVGVAANGLVFVGAVLLARGAPRLAAAPPAPTARTGGVGRWILPLILVSGAISFAYEVLWSRLLAHLLGGSVYAFATMLASFLMGIAVGSALAARFASSPERAARGFAFAQLGTAALSVAAFAAIDRMPALSVQLAATVGSPLAIDVAVAVATLFPAALCIGATFPLAVRVLARSEADAAPASARVFAWNTVGAIVGSVAAGFFAIPALGYAGMLTLAVVLNLALAFSALVSQTSIVQRGVLIALGVVGCVALLPPAPPWKLLRASVLHRDRGGGIPVFYAVGRIATVLVQTTPSGYRIRTNGLPEALVTARGGLPGAGRLVQWMGALPSLARPDARNMLVIGLGGGSHLEAIPSAIESIDVVELEPEVIRANRVIGPERRKDPLSDPRIRLIANDARGSLLLTDKRYDVIVSQPSHPWTAGSSHLYTREFFELARDHLNPDGVLLQWMGLRFVDESLLRTLVATLLEVFPHVTAYRPVAGGMLFLAGEQPLAVGANAARAIEAAPADFLGLGVLGVEDVAAVTSLHGEGARAFSAGAPINTDDRNLLQMRSPSLVRGARDRIGERAFVAFDPLMRATPRLDRVVLVRRLLARRFPERARRVAEATRDPVERAAGVGLVALAEGRPGVARSALERALALDAGAREARAALLQIRRADIVAGDATALVLASAVGDPEMAVAEGWRAIAEGGGPALRGLEERLARVGPRDPLFAAALRLRIRWRIQTGDPLLANEAAALTDLLIATGGVEPRALVLRAQALAAAGEGQAVLVTLVDLARRLNPTAANRAIAAHALKVLDSVPRVAAPQAWAQLEESLRSVLRANGRDSESGPRRGAPLL